MTINWSATDSGSGLTGPPTPASSSVTGNTAGSNLSSTVTDKVGNQSTDTVFIKLDKYAPTISGSRSPAANAFGWNNDNVTVSFTCTDEPTSPTGSGIKVCIGSQTLTAEGANQSQTGTAIDNADNSASTMVSGISIDKTPPTFSGAPTSPPNAAGWYNGNVVIHWTAGDALSGLSGSAFADSTIASEGTSR